ncbi:MAG: hypothetical protein DU429_02260 [Candidatus Tokpelaia sp.]|nr:MAG: hypothetical protein DU430_05010 [Candidatus Tokpelaia sp.]KAA6207317.1 MAG: hypothetical protein DU429_02260 [Candidatus Tokpelaia sp.]
MSKMSRKPFPVFHSDEEAEHFVDTADLSEYDFSGGRFVHYEFRKKDASLNMKLPAQLAEEGKAKARAAGIPFSRYIRLLLEADIKRKRSIAL